MSITGLEVFDSAMQQTNAWLKSLMGKIGTGDRHRAYAVLRVTLHALRDRLPPEVAAHLGAQLPMLVRGFYYEDWRMAGTPTRDRHKEEFFAPIAAAVRGDPEIRPKRWQRPCSRCLRRGRRRRDPQGGQRPDQGAARALAGRGERLNPLRRTVSNGERS